MKTPEQPEIKTETEPKFKFDIFYSAHRTPEDFEGLKEAFDRADIYIPEGLEWTPYIEEKLKEIADGMLSPEEAGLADIQVNGRLIYKSHKPVMFVDIPRGSPLLEQRYKWGSRFQTTQAHFLSGDFMKALKLRKVELRDYAKMNEKREGHMSELLQSRLPQLLEKYPALRARLEQKGSLKVLLSLGSVHTPLYHGLKKEGHDVARKFSKSEVSYPSLVEFVRRVQFGKKVDDELVARTFIEEELLENTRIRGVTMDANKEFQFLRKVISSLRLDDIKQISENVGLHGKDFEEELAAHGISIPRTEKELDDMLKKKQ